MIGLLTLSLLFSISLFVSLASKRAYAPVIDLLDKATETALTGQFEDAIANANTARSLWEKHRNKTATVADHTPMEEIDVLFTEVAVYAKAEDTLHFAACCAQLSSMVQNMADAHAINLWNLL